MRKKVINLEHAATFESVYHSFQTRKNMLLEHRNKLRLQLDLLSSLKPEDNHRMMESISSQLEVYKNLLTYYQRHPETTCRIQAEIGRLEVSYQKLENSLTAQAPARILSLQQRLARIQAQIEHIDISMSEWEIMRYSRVPA